jgi:hypothetical protein
MARFASTWWSRRAQAPRDGAVRVEAGVVLPSNVLGLAATFRGVRMIRTAVGHSEDVDSADAANAALDQALAGVTGAAPRAMLVFTGIGVDPRAVLDVLTARLPGVALVGGTTAAELSRTLGPVECSVMVTLFAGDGLEVAAGCGAEGDAARSAVRAVEQATALLRSPAKLCLCIANPVTQSLGAAIRTLSERLGPEVLVTGAGSAGEVNVDVLRPNEFFGGELFEGAVTVLLFGGELRVAHALELGWEPVGEAHVATKVVAGQILVELDGRPAAEVLAESLGGAGGTGVGFVHHPLAVEVAGGTLLRGAITAGPIPGSYVLGSEIAEGASVRFCEFDRAVLVQATQRAASRALADWQGAPPSAALVFECLTRWNVLGTGVRRAAELLQQVLPPETTLVGAYVGGEVAPFRAGLAAETHNCSGVVVLLGSA